MKFSEYYKYFNDTDEVIENIRKCAEKYIKNIMIEQTVSIGNSSNITFDKKRLLVCSKDEKLQVSVNSYKIGTCLCLEVYTNNIRHIVSINPLYFKKENIKNYLRDCEIDIKNQFRKIRKLNS